MELSKATELARSFAMELAGVLQQKVVVEVGSEGEELYLNLKGELPLLADHEALSGALAHLLRRHLRRELETDLSVTVDFNGVFAARRDQLVSQAREMAQLVVDTGRKQRLLPMNPRDRRTVHMALADFAGVRTRSAGQGSARRVVIEPSV